MPNEVEYRRWNDEQQVAGWPKRERFTDRITPHVVAALGLRPGEQILDVGSGGGKLSLAVAEAVGPGGKVVGADISAGMVQLATGRAREAKAKNVSFGQHDVQGAKIRGGPFDAMTSQFGVMFFEDPVAAFSNIRRHLKPGGRIAFACWQGAAKNLWFPGRVLAPFMPVPPTPPPGRAQSGPFAFGEPRYVRSVLSGAGFSDIVRTPKKLIVVAPSDAIADDSQLIAVPGAKRAEARAAMMAHFDHFRRLDGLGRFELNVHIFTARKPLLDR
ncbi:MAG: class I SAM-dependent methyltransferase [Dehalococcoidia bacterium]